MNEHKQAVPVQTGEPFHCWECGAPDQGGMFLVINHSPLEIYADHIYYMRLGCGHNNRCIRLGDVISPLQPLDGPVAENVSLVRRGIEALARQVPPGAREQDPAAKIVYLLVAGRISPQGAINQLRKLSTFNTPRPVFSRQAAPGASLHR